MIDPATSALILACLGLLISGIHLGHRTLKSECLGGKIEISEPKAKKKNIGKR
jgi:hypothetical protein